MPPDNAKGLIPVAAGLDPHYAPNGKPDDSKSNTPKARLQFLARRLHALGPYPLWRFLGDIEGGKPIRPTLEEYAALPADFIKDSGGDELGPIVFPLRGAADDRS